MRKQTPIFRQFRLLVTIVGILAVLPEWVQARHIIGGTMSYECLGNNRYEFTLRVYRDCNCSACANIDPVAEIGIYRCDMNGNCPDQSQSRPFRELSVPLLNILPIEEPSYPCLIPPNVCGEEGIYRFTVDLPVSTSSYVIAYQRCCRNVTITNIFQPNDSGATFSIELTPQAQTVCNSSPVFDTYPPIIICNNYDLLYDHSATDPDGDVLIYELCAPLLGGGPLLDPGTYNTCAGANPIPACPPPYDEVVFRGPEYTPLAPMGGDPVVTIDPLTGLIYGRPNIQGQFVVGVCVSEFRNGVLLSRVVRDFQFNVANCDPTVVADVQEDIMLSQSEFEINSCGNPTINFVNQSYQQSFINNFRWTFDMGGGQMQTINDVWSPTVTFPGVGNYPGILILNENTECGDTAYVNVNIFPDIQADFSFVYDTCVAGPTLFTDLSQTGACCLTDWDWSFGDGQRSTLQNPEHIYRVPGLLPVTLTVRDTNACTASMTRPISYFPVPALIVISPSAAVACSPVDIFFDNLSFPIDTTYNILWDFGDGGTSTAISPTHTYAEPGMYTVSVDITSPIGCGIDTTFNNLITVLPSPEAGFTYTPDQLSNLVPQIQLSDASIGATAWRWSFGDGGSSILPNPIYTYRDTGMYQLMQVVFHPSGCTDTALALIDVIPEIRYYLPNAFTPNGDGSNDDFKGKGLLGGIRFFEMRIWNRYGEPVFVTNDPFEGWNGRKNNTGQDAPPGVYLVTVQLVNPRNEKEEIKGNVVLIR